MPPGLPIQRIVLTVASLLTFHGQLCLAQTITPTATGETYTPKLTFDVGSIRKTDPDGAFRAGGGFAPHTAKLDMENASLPSILVSAYGVNSNQIVGLPDWARDTYTIHAKGDDTADALLKSLSNADSYAEQQHMLQVLLADRMKLKVHWENKETPGFALVVGKSSPKLTLAVPDPPPAEGQPAPPRRPPIRQTGSAGNRALEGHGASMKQFAAMLTLVFNRPVEDKTGLTGLYDFRVPYDGTLEPPPSPSNSEILLDAVPDELGLKLEPVRATMRVLIIDHVEKPAAD